MRLGQVFLLFIILLIAGCVKSVDPTNQAAISEAIEKTVDKETGDTILAGPLVTSRGSRLGGGEAYQLRARYAAGSDAFKTIELFASVCCNRGKVKWLRLNGANRPFEQNTIFNTVPIPQSAGGVTFYVSQPMNVLQFTVPMQTGELGTLANSGITIRYLDANFVKEFPVTPQYITAFRAALPSS